MSPTRRSFLKSATALTVAGAWTLRRTLADESTGVFPQSVSSGDPSPTGVVLWTRIDPDAYSAADELVYDVASRPDFSDVVLTGTIPPAAFGPDRDFSVHLDLDGQLSPGRVYYYRFRYRGTTSHTGRCRTLPEPDADVDAVRFGVLTCQEYSNGYYGALAALARENIDFVIHLGDFIYEVPTYDPNGSTYPDRDFTLPSGAAAASGLDDYRFLHRTYRSDPWLQLLLEQHTLIAIWDDHETANDCYWDYARDTLGAPDHPFTQETPDGGDAAKLRQLKLNSQRAWGEYTPARVAFNSLATHPHDALSIFRQFRFGSLLDLFCTDERTYRSPHPCGEDERILTTGCPERTSPRQTMLGTNQKTWFLNGVTNSDARWKVWANEVFLGQLRLKLDAEREYFFNLDAWDGYEAERVELLTAIRAGGVRNFVALTGDLHTYMTSYLKIDYDQRSNLPGSNVVGVEFMTPAVTSSTMIQQLTQILSPADLKRLHAKDTPQTFLLENVARATNPHIVMFNSQQWGYSIVEFKHTGCTYSAYTVDTSQNRGNLPAKLLRRYWVPAGVATILQTA